MPSSVKHTWAGSGRVRETGQQPWRTTAPEMPPDTDTRAEGISLGHALTEGGVDGYG